MTLYVLTIVSHSAESENLRTTLGEYLGGDCGVTLLTCISNCVSGKYTLDMYCLVYYQAHVASVDS